MPSTRTESSLNRHQRRLPPDHVYTHIDVTSPSLASGAMSITKDDLIELVRSRFKDDEDGNYLESNQNELWVCYNDSNTRVTEIIISATANFSRPKLPKSYDDGITDYRGVIHIGEPVNRTIPVYLWPDTSLQSELFFCLTGKDPVGGFNIPEGYREGSRKWTEVSHKKFETSLIIQMFDWPEEELPEWVEYEPNGPSTFPDFRVSESSLFRGDTAIEITRIFNYQSRMIDTVRYGTLADSSDQRLKALAQNAPLSETEIRESIEKALKRKSERVSQLNAGQKYMLILVSDILPLEANFRVFQGQDYSAFDCVVLANQTGELSFAFQTIKRLDT